MADDSLYGPFLDEELFYYHDKADLEMNNLEIYDTDRGFVGFDDLEKIHNLGRAGSFDNVMFSGHVTLKKTSSLCEGGFKKLLQEVKAKDPTMTPNRLHKACKAGDITIELHCQLSIMPVCYLTKSPAHSILIYSKNNNNINNQRRYIVSTFHIACFLRSELTLQRYFILKFIIDVCKKYRTEVPREERDVHWLVGLYLEDHSAVFLKYELPRLHRSEVYDHFATHAEWLKKVFSKKLLVDKDKWEDWIEEVKHLKKKGKRAKIKWGVRIKRPVRTLSLKGRSPLPGIPPRDDMDIDDFNIDVPDVPSSEAELSSDEESSSSSSDESEGEVEYSLDPSLRSRVHRGLLSSMPAPKWYWSCNIKDGCHFTIIIGHRRQRDAPCMAPLNDKEKDYLMGTTWGLYDRKLAKIWKKMCQAHMDTHWKDVGLVMDHGNKRVHGIEELPFVAESDDEV